MSDELYGYGTECTWHGPATFASQVATSEQDRACPRCGQLLHMVTADEFWSTAARFDRDHPGHEAMLRWSQGKCFPDFETMQNAYRQAMEGTE